MSGDFSKLSVYLDKNRRVCEDSLKIKDWVGLSIRMLYAEIQAAKEKQVLSGNGRVLELGSGNGSAAIVWAYSGHPVVGIEYHRRLVDFSEDMIEKCDQVDKERIQVIHGSYYPKDYISSREREERADSKKKNNYRQIEDALDHGRERFHPVCEEDVYEKNMMSISDFDILHAYLWPVQVPSIVEMFQTYARDDALLFMPFQESLAKKCGLEKLGNTEFYQKGKLN